MKRLIYFSAEWCAPCRKVSPMVAELAELTSGLEVVKVDININPEAARHYRVMAVPTLILEVDGEPVGEMTGAKSRADLLAFIEG